ncbi:MAG: 23S rRNA (guanosine(2251)-2'-O)-methyltransferase RlmB, partial [Candidatus Limnocylindrales bacterium]
MYRPALAGADTLGSGEELVAGRRPVEEAFAARRPAIRLLVTPGRRAALERLVLHATTLRIPIVEVEGGTLTSIAGFDGHQGVALVVEPRRFATLDEVLARAIERGEPPFILVLDSLEDPQNLGTVLRSAEAAGVHGVLFPTERQAPLSPAAIKASAGATEHLLLCPVDDLPQALADLHVRGLRVVGSEAEAPLSARQDDLRGPLAIVVGSEGHGLTPAVRRRCDTMVRIPMRGAIGSLNAAVAGSILLFEALGQRDPEARPAPTAGGPGADAPSRGRRRSAPEPDDDAPVVAIEAAPPGAVEALPAEPDVLEEHLEPPAAAFAPPAAAIEPTGAHDSPVESGTAVAGVDDKAAGPATREVVESAASAKRRASTQKANAARVAKAADQPRAEPAAKAAKGPNAARTARTALAEPEPERAVEANLEPAAEPNPAPEPPKAARRTPVKRVRA